MVDDDAVSCSDLRGWSAEFDSVTDRISSLFVHRRSRVHARQYLAGLLVPIERKNGWTIAEYVGEKEPKAMRRFLNLTCWDADALRDVNRDYVMENLGDPEGILIADPTGFAKKGTKSAGVQRQYSGTLGRVDNCQIDNCQIGTFLAWVSSAGDRVLIDRELYIPEESWCGDRQRCTEAAIPADLEFATRPAQVIAMIKRTIQGRGGVPVVHRGRGVRRLYPAWYRHITLAMLAHTVLAVLAHRHRAKKGGSTPGDAHPATAETTDTMTPNAPKSSLRHRIRLSLTEIRRLFNLRDQAKQLIHTAIGWSTYRRQHQAEARRHHFRQRLKIQALAL